MIKIIIKLTKYIFFIILGMVLFKNNWFPVQQLVSIKHYIYPVQKHDKKLSIANNFNQFILTQYLPKTPLFSDRNYYDVINDKKLENSYLIQIPRHYKNNIIIESQKKIIVYRILSEDNDENEDKPTQPIVKKKSYPNYSEIKKQIDLKRQEDEEQQARSNSKVSKSSEVYVQSSSEQVEADRTHKRIRNSKENKAISIARRLTGVLLMIPTGVLLAGLFSFAFACGENIWIAFFFVYLTHLLSIGIADKKQNEWKTTTLIFFPKSKPIKIIYYLLLALAVLTFLITLTDQSVCPSSL